MCCFSPVIEQLTYPEIVPQRRRQSRATIEILHLALQSISVVQSCSSLIRHPNTAVIGVILRLLRKKAVDLGNLEIT